MTTSTPNSHILVGVDGSTSALHALTWAGAEAQRRNLYDTNRQLFWD